MKCNKKGKKIWLLSCTSSLKNNNNYITNIYLVAYSNNTVYNRSQDAEEDNHLSGKIESDPIVDRDLPESQILNTQNSSEIQLKCKDLKSHNVVQSTSGQMYKYNEARYKTHLAKNIQTRRRLLRARILKCEECNYQAKRMRYLRIHQLRHVEYKGAQMYMCDKCEYQSKIKVYFTRHVSKHKDT